MNKNKTVDDFLRSNTLWYNELVLLRSIISSSELQENIKWDVPVYSANSKNIVGIGVFKAYVALWFYQGALLKDKHKKLINAQEGITKALRQWRFNSIKEIDKKLIFEYIQEAMQNQKDGKEIKSKKKQLIISTELQDILNTDYELKDCFENFSISKRIEFADYISEAKRESTKQLRLSKIKALILSGVGLNDKYKKLT